MSKPIGTVQFAHAAACMRVAKLYGDNRAVTNRLSWQALVELAASALPDDVRRELEQQMLAGANLSAADIYKARLRAA